VQGVVQPVGAITMTDGLRLHLGVHGPPVQARHLRPSHALLVDHLAVDDDVLTNERKEDACVGLEALRHRHPDLEGARCEKRQDPLRGAGDLNELGAWEASEVGGILFVPPLVVLSRRRVPLFTNGAIPVHRRCPRIRNRDIPQGMTSGSVADFRARRGT
jgi:hypothetical protein